MKDKKFDERNKKFEKTMSKDVNLKNLVSDGLTFH